MCRLSASFSCCINQSQERQKLFPLAVASLLWRSQFRLRICFTARVGAESFKKGIIRRRSSLTNIGVSLPSKTRTYPNRHDNRLLFRCFFKAYQLVWGEKRHPDHGSTPSRSL